MTQEMARRLDEVEQMARRPGFKLLGRFALASLEALDEPAIRRLKTDDPFREAVFGRVLDAWLANREELSNEQLEALLQADEGVFMANILDLFTDYVMRMRVRAALKDPISSRPKPIKRLAS